MSKSYLRYKLQDTLGVITTSTVETLFLPNTDDKVAITPTLEDVTIWHIRTNLSLKVLHDPDNRSLVTSMAIDKTGQRLAVGYENGSIRIWDIENNEVLMVLNGHNIAVSVLRFDQTDTHLISGSRDTDIVVWDVTSQQGLYRLKGHKDEITDLNFLTITTQVPYPHTPKDILTTAVRLDDVYVRSTHETKLLISSSKDGCVRLWDLSVQHCLYTLTGHPGEVWSFDLLHHTNTPSALLVTGSTDKFLRTWSIQTNIVVTDPDMETTEVAALFERTGVTFTGVVDRPAGRRRVIRVRFSQPQFDELTPASKATTPSQILAVYGQDKCVETYLVRTEQDKIKRQKRRQKRHREKLADIKQKITQKKATQQQLEDAEADAPPQYLPSDDLETILPIRVDERVSSLLFCTTPVRPRKSKYQRDPHDVAVELHAIVCTSQNSIEKWVAPLIPLVKTQNELVSVADQTGGYKVHQSIVTPGHRQGVRCCDLSSDDSLLLTTAGLEMKFWCMRQHKHLRTIMIYTGQTDEANASTLYNSTMMGQVDIDDSIENDSILSSCFLPGNRHVLIGTKLGYIDLYDIDSTTLLHRERSDDKSPIWSIDLQPDGKGFATTCGKQVWFWDLEIIDVEEHGDDNDNNGGMDDDSDDHSSPKVRGAVTINPVRRRPNRQQKRLIFSQSRILQLTDDALCIKHSPDGRYIAIGLLDATVRIFHHDTLAFFLSLYGHKLPVLCIDISDDSTLVLTGSSDKTIKLWGIDFGDCRRSLIAHDNSVMRVKFVPRTHYFFTIGKDHLVRYWDADRFHRIMTLQGHHAEVWALAISSKGDFIITCSNDKSIRRWYQSDEIVLKGDDEEELLDNMVDSSLTQLSDTTSQQIGDIEGGIVKGQNETDDVWTRGLRGRSAIQLAEYLIQALDVCQAETDNWKRYHELVRKTRKERLQAQQLKSKSLSSSSSSSGTVAKPLSTIEKLKAMQDEQMGKEEALPLDASDVPAPQSSPLLLGKTPSQYILMVLRSMPLAELSTILVTIPYESGIILLSYLSRLIDQGCEIELCTRAALVLMRIHKNQLTSSNQHAEILAALRHSTRVRLLRHRKMIGTNMAALQFIATKIEEKESQKSFSQLAEIDQDGGLSALEKKKKDNKFTTRAVKRARTTIKHLKPKGMV